MKEPRNMSDYIKECSDVSACPVRWNTEGNCSHYNIKALMVERTITKQPNVLWKHLNLYELYCLFALWFSCSSAKSWFFMMKKVVDTVKQRKKHPSLKEKMWTLNWALKILSIYAKNKTFRFFQNKTLSHLNVMLVVLFFAQNHYFEKKKFIYFKHKMKTNTRVKNRNIKNSVIEKEGVEENLVWFHPFLQNLMLCKCLQALKT